MVTEWTFSLITLNFVDRVLFWYKNTTLLFSNESPISNEKRFKVNKDHSLTIENVQAEDQGQYKCTVALYPIAMIANLEVITPVEADIFLNDGRRISNASITYPQGARIELECRTKSTGSVIKWFLSGQPISSNNTVYVNGGNLVIKRADRWRGGLYQCLVEKGQIRSHASININVVCKCLSIRFSFTLA